MFASKFSNNRRFMAPRGEFCKPCNIHYYYYCNPEYADMDRQNIIAFNFTNKMNLTSNILTNKYFSQKACNQNFGEGLKDFVVGPSLDATNAYTNFSNARIGHFHPTNMQPVDGNAHKISDMYTYLIDLIKSFFSSWKGPDEQEQNLGMIECSTHEADNSYNKNNSIQKDIHDCDLVTNEESHCIVTKNVNESIENSTKNRKTCCDTADRSTLNSIKPCLKMKTEGKYKTMDDYDLGSSKYSREVNRLNSLKKKKQRRMAAQERKKHYNRDTNRRWQHNKDWNRNKIDIKDDLDEVTTKNCKSENRDCYDDDFLNSEKLVFLENCRNIAHSSPTLKSSMPLVINTNSLVVTADQTLSSSLEDSHPVRFRNVSECESEDSFIVFAKDDNVCDDESEFDDGESICIFFEDDTTEDEEEIQKSQITNRKKVSFASDKHLCKVHHMVKWSYAYQAARKGPWEECARDRERFMLRIRNLEPELSKVFDPKLRKRIYNERFAANVPKRKSMASKVKCRKPLK
ncbi:uncharacterized protein LOC108740769 [Agrilus planipennis]|uniref:Uncharacterized protein LOC108740769 n=1 Tax=Agrilus planipennis TaxID=224129 RepID=A0A1W4X3S0_AGRPL|nr:uncharacterized protein LOC108740769 [Agrilus planipennis]